MKIYDEVGTPFAKACQDKLSSSIAKGVSKHKAREEKVMAGSKRKSSGMLHADGRSMVMSVKSSGMRNGWQRCIRTAESSS